MAVEGRARYSTSARGCPYADGRPAGGTTQRISSLTRNRAVQILQDGDCDDVVATPVTLHGQTGFCTARPAAARPRRSDVPVRAFPGAGRGRDRGSAPRARELEHGGLAARERLRV